MFGEQITHFLKKKTPTNCNSGKNKQNRRQWMLYSSFVIMIDFDKGRLVDCKKNQVEYHLPLRGSREKKLCRLASSSAVLRCSEKTAEHWWYRRFWRGFSPVAFFGGFWISAKGSFFFFGGGKVWVWCVWFIDLYLYPEPCDLISLKDRGFCYDDLEKSRFIEKTLRNVQVVRWIGEDGVQD